MKKMMGMLGAVVLGAVGGRLDHQLAVMGALLHCTIADLRLVCPGQTVRLLRTGGEATIERVGITFSVIAPQEATVSISGARWPLDHTRLGALSSHGLSNECTADTARVTVHSGCAFLIMNSTGSD